MADRNITVRKSWPRPATPCNLIPSWEGEFRDHQDWVSFASKRLTVATDSNGHPLSAMCVDTLGRRCHNGRDMARARDEGTFPVRYFFECTVSEEALPNIEGPAPLPVTFSEMAEHFQETGALEAVGVIDPRDAEIERLTKEADDHAEAASRWRSEAGNSEAEIERLREALAKAEANAARYQWLRDNSCPPHNFYISVPDEFHGICYSPQEVDAYIDEARAALAKSEGK